MLISPWAILFTFIYQANKKKISTPWNLYQPLPVPMLHIFFFFARYKIDNSNSCYLLREFIVFLNLYIWRCSQSLIIYCGNQRPLGKKYSEDIEIFQRMILLQCPVIRPATRPSVSIIYQNSGAVVFGLNTPSLPPRQNFVC